MFWPFYGFAFFLFSLLITVYGDQKKTREPMFLALWVLLLIVTLLAISIDMGMQHIIGLLSEVR